MYGTANGSVGLIKIAANNAATMWEIQGKTAVETVSSGDFTQDGVEDVIIGRADGGIELYSFDISSIPNRIFERNVNESITGIQTGHVTSSNSVDIIMSTYSGKVLAYSSNSQTAVS